MYDGMKGGVENPGDYCLTQEQMKDVHYFVRLVCQPA